MIDLDEPAADTDPSTAARLRRALVAPAPAVLVVAAMVLLAGFVWATTRAEPVAAPTGHLAVHLVQVGVSAYPAQVVAAWVDVAGVRHDLDPWSGQALRLAARVVWVAVAAGADPIQCTLQVDGQTVDGQTAQNGVRLCEWTAT